MRSCLKGVGFLCPTQRAAPGALPTVPLPSITQLHCDGHKCCLRRSWEREREKKKGATLYSSLVPSFPSWLGWKTKQTAVEKKKRIGGAAELRMNVGLFFFSFLLNHSGHINPDAFCCSERILGLAACSALF